MPFIWFNLRAMSRICDICEKSSIKGNQVPRGIGRRVTRRSIIKQLPNLRSKKLDINGQSIKVKLCSSCLKRIRKDKRDAAAEAAKTA